MLLSIGKGQDVFGQIIHEVSLNLVALASLAVELGFFRVAKLDDVSI
jgi:hypothetical protein